MSVPCRTILGIWITILVGVTSQYCGGAEKSERSNEDLIFFEKTIRPLLADHCIKCHGSEKQESGLRLDSLDGLLAGGENGPPITPGDVKGSLLISAVRYEELEMPPTGKLPQEKIDALADWISRGAYWPKVEGGGGTIIPKKFGLSEDDRQYWAFQPLEKSPVPHVNSSARDDRVRTPVDRFILAKLQSAGLSFSPEASRGVIARRLYFDLVGVPPTLEELDAFLGDQRDDAYERLIDRLLEDVRYGQHWARHWLDLVRYAESDGFKQDAYRPTAYLYRDYVIDALNSDKPYDRFVREQLAGDEIDNRDPELLAATGYLRHWIYEYNQRDVRTQWSNILNDLTDVTGEVLLGLGFGCARCHDHKFDPILQKDYFRLQASFAGILPNDAVPYAAPDKLAEHRKRLAEWELATDEIRREMAEIESSARINVATKAIDKFPPEIRPWLRRMGDQRSPLEKQIADLAFRQVTGEWNAIDFTKTLKGEAKERWVMLRENLAKFDQLKPESLPTILAAADVGPEAPPVFIPQSGTVAEPIAPATIEVLGGQLLRPVPPNDGRSTGRRTALADWINSPDNPLAHRVIVNRVWQYHFGTGLVGNASDFGRLGESPMHPELLDWLSVWFLENGRSLKQLHRLVLSSAVYRQASRHPQGDLCRQADIANKLWWHFPARRLDAEQVRDAMLVATGKIDWSAGGPSSSHDSHRRTIFTKVMRNTPNPLLNTMDGPDGSSSVAKRNVTTTAIQSLLLTNAPWPIELASSMASDLVRKAELPERQIELAYLRVVQRSPSNEELESAVGFLQLQAAAVRNEASQRTKNADIAGAEGRPPAPARQAGRAEAGRTFVVRSEAREGRQPAADLQATVASLSTWNSEQAYLSALTDFCHVLLNSSEFLYVD